MTRFSSFLRLDQHILIHHVIFNCRRFDGQPHPCEGKIQTSTPDRAPDGSERYEYESSFIDERHAAASKSDDISGDAGDGGYEMKTYVNDPQVSEEDEPEKDVDCHAIYDR